MTSTRNKPILCVDFDGVIHSYSSPWVDATTIPDPPVSGALRWLWAATEWFDVQIYSSRSKTEEGRSAMRGWMKYHSLDEFSADHPMAGGASIYPIGFASEKPAAFLTIDDRAICFEGDFSDLGESPADLLDFKPWNKRPPPAKMTIDQVEDHINRNGSASVQIRPDGTVRTRGLNAALSAGECADIQRRHIAHLKARIDSRVDNYLSEMKSGYDDSITGFNECWDLVRKAFAETMENNPVAALPDRSAPTQPQEAP
jgi:hypothetical protein